MEIVILDDDAAIAALAADAICALLAHQPRAVLGLATGSSPLPTYRELITRCCRRSVSFASARAFLLDEYVGLPAGHPESYRAFIEREFTSRIDIDPSAVVGPDGNAVDLLTECASYDAAVTAAGVDVQLLGIGSDGHIGFNEPTSSLASRTRLKTLTRQTRADNARFFASPDEVPKHVITQGIGTILQAKHLMLIATGSAKAAAIAAAVEGPIAARCPASALQLHPHATVLVDEPAAAELQLAGYYRDTYDQKPDWQGL
jgi:glucosamine-6-phosphate deaminase